MRTKLLIGSLALALASIALPACGSSSDSDGPIINSLTVTDSPVAANDDGSYTIDMDIDFDDDVAVDTVLLDCSDGVSGDTDLHETFDITPIFSGDVDITVTLPDGTATGDYTCQVQLEDQDGFDSDAYQITFILEDN